MKKFMMFAMFVASFVGYGFMKQPVYALDDVQFVPSEADVNDIGGCTGSAASSPVCTDIRSNTNPLFGPDGILTRVAQIFSIVTGIISVFMITLGGLRYITSSGDSAKTISAKNTILYSAIGITVAALAAVIAQFILSRLT